MILYILIASPFKFIVKHPFSHLTKNLRSELSSYRVSIKAMSVDSSSSITQSIYLFGWLEKLATILFISFNLNLPFRVVTLLIYMSEIPLLDPFSYLLLTEQFTGIIPVGHQTFVSALKIPAMKTSKNLFIPFPFVPPIGSFTYFRQFENSSDNHHCIGFKSSFSSFFSYFSKAKLWGWIIRCSLFTTLFFKKSVLFDLCQKIRPYT